ncbi:MAG: site-2 protease family protein [Nitrososphaerota archaeon]|nr:site-2 protease family protein [Nitrososphaerota archaeon]MDG6983244.1 site-2 protease family protein [Nitrososphaerota archaeon]
MGSDEFKRFELQSGVLLMVRTRRFLSVMDRMGKSTISRPVGWLLLYLMPVSAAIGLYLYFMVFQGILSPGFAQASRGIVGLGPLINLGIPGLNPYIPIFYGWVALVVGMVVHEGAHGVIARSHGLRVKNSGLILLFFVIPIGAFVDIDETEVRQARKRHAAQMLAAGAGTNLVLAVACLVLLALVVGSMTPAAIGAGITGVSKESPAYSRGILPGDIVLAVNGTAVTDLSTILGENTSLKAGQSLDFTIYRSGQVIQIDNVTLVCCDQLVNTTTNKVLAEWPYIGVGSVSASSIRSAVSAYSDLLNNPFIYIACIPTLDVGRCQGVVPFSSADSAFYTSPIGAAVLPLANQIYWLFFININLAIFNSLPIYPLDGGQAFRVGVEALGRGKLSEKMVGRITVAATLTVLALLIAIITAPYFYVYVLGV